MRSLRYDRFVICAVGVLLSNWALAADAKPDRTIVYKDSDAVELRLHVFDPKGAAPAGGRSAVVFFFGGGWVGGNPSQFYPHCAYLASRGMFACSAEYRVASRNGTSPFSCVRDGKAAVRWIRAHAKELGVNPDKIVAGGGSAGGHVAASTALLPEIDVAGQTGGVSSQPNALMLFNPVIDTTYKGYGDEKLPGCARELSPVHHVVPGLPSAIVFHGTADTTVPFENVARFEKLMKKAGNSCVLVPFEGEKHGFFNKGRNNGAFEITLEKAGAFLVKHGFLAP